MKVNEKFALVTGASSGIGYGIAQRLSKEGYRVIINSRSKLRLDKASKKILNSIPIPADITCQKQSKSLIAAAKKYTKQIDLLVCNVGSGSSAPPGDELHKDWQRMFDLNFFSSTNMIEASRGFITENTGSIVCISSICGIDYIPGAPVTYSVAKSALNHYIKVSSRIFAKKGIRINGIAPGNILFPNSSWDKKMKDDPSKIKLMLSSNVALNRFGRVEEISDMVSFLSSSESNFITGTVIPVDGGQLR